MYKLIDITSQKQLRNAEGKMEAVDCAPMLLVVILVVIMNLGRVIHAVLYLSFCMYFVFYLL